MNLPRSTNATLRVETFCNGLGLELGLGYVCRVQWSYSDKGICGYSALKISNEFVLLFSCTVSRKTNKLESL